MSQAADSATLELPADLAAIAAAGDAELDGQAVIPGQEPAAPVDQGIAFASMLKMSVMVLAPAMPFLPCCYTEQACDQIGTAFKAVAEKRGWDLSKLDTPEIALACVAVPPTIAAVVQGRAYFAHKRAELEAAEKAKRDQVGQVDQAAAVAVPA